MTDVLLIAKQRRQRLLAEIDKLDEFILIGEALVAWNHRSNVLEGSTAPRAIAAARSAPAPAREPQAEAAPVALEPAEEAAHEEAAVLVANGDAAPALEAPAETAEVDEAEVLVLRNPLPDRATRPDTPVTAEAENTMISDRVASAVHRGVEEISGTLRAAVSAGLDETATSRIERKDVAAFRGWVKRVAARAERLVAALPALPLNDRATSDLSRNDVVAMRDRLYDAVEPVSERFEDVFGAALRHDETATTWVDGTNLAIRERIDELLGRTPPSLPVVGPVLAAGAEEPSHDVDLHVGRRLRQLRWMLGLSQHQVGEKAGVGFDRIGEFETGAQAVTAGGLWDLARALGVPVSFFFDGLEGQAAESDATRSDLLSDTEALELVRAYYAIPEGQRQRLFDLARVLKEAA